MCGYYIIDNPYSRSTTHSRYVTCPDVSVSKLGAACWLSMEHHAHDGDYGDARHATCVVSTRCGPDRDFPHGIHGPQKRSRPVLMLWNVWSIVGCAVACGWRPFRFRWCPHSCIMNGHGLGVGPRPRPRAPALTSMACDVGRRFKSRYVRT